MYDDNIYNSKLEAAGLAIQAKGFAGHLGCVGMSIREAARFLGIGRTTIYDEIKSGRLIARKVGARTIITTEDAVAYLRALPQIAAQAA